MIKKKLYIGRQIQKSKKINDIKSIEESKPRKKWEMK